MVKNQLLNTKQRQEHVDRKAKKSQTQIETQKRSQIEHCSKQKNQKATQKALFETIKEFTEYGQFG